MLESRMSGGNREILIYPNGLRLIFRDSVLSEIHGELPKPPEAVSPENNLGLESGEGSSAPQTVEAFRDDNMSSESTADGFGQGGDWLAAISRARSHPCWSK